MRSFIFTVQIIYVQYLFQKKRFNLIDIFTVSPVQYIQIYCTIIIIKKSTGTGSTTLKPCYRGARTV